MLGDSLFPGGVPNFDDAYDAGIDPHQDFKAYVEAKIAGELPWNNGNAATAAANIPVVPVVAAVAVTPVVHQYTPQSVGDAQTSNRPARKSCSLM
jgi:hypothetical protein